MSSIMKSDLRGTTEPCAEYTVEGIWQRDEIQRQQIWSMLQTVASEPPPEKSDITARLWNNILGWDRSCKYCMKHRVLGCYMFICKRCKQWGSLAIVSQVRSKMSAPIIPFRIEIGSRSNEMYKVTNYDIYPRLTLRGYNLYCDDISNHIIQQVNLSQVCKKYGIPTIQFETAFICGTTVSVIERDITTKFGDVWSLLAPFEADVTATRVERLLSILQQLWAILDCFKEIGYEDRPMAVSDLLITRDNMVNYTYNGKNIQGVCTIYWKPSCKATSYIMGTPIKVLPHPELYEDKLRLSMDFSRIRSLWPNHNGEYRPRGNSMYYVQWTSLVSSLKQYSAEIDTLFKENDKLRRIDEFLAKPIVKEFSTLISDSIADILWS